MIRLRIKDKSYIYDVFHIVKAFFPNETVEQEIDEDQGMFLELEVCVQERICRICAEIKELDAYETKKEKKQYLDRKIYRALAEYSGKTLAWGILTGIRPTKIAMKMLEEQMEEAEIQRTLMEQYLMSEEKARLGIENCKAREGPGWSSLIMKMDIVSMWESHSVRPPVRTVRLPHTRSKHGRRGWRNISMHSARKSAMSGIFQKRRN